MDIKVKLSNLRTAPRKVRQVIDLVRGKRVQEAQSILLFTVNKSARQVLKLLNSAIATAKNDLHLDESNLFISKITVDEGPKLKRWHPMSRGRAYPIIKRSSHIALVLSEKSPTIKETKIKETTEVKTIKKAVVKKVKKLTKSKTIKK
ncbi:MAG: 50S ribosomal protein L22 [Candidatus Staskawiczbacteria bacterium]|jgi:large subunit ribosomal protein L22